MVTSWMKMYIVGKREAGISVGLKFLNGWSGKELLEKGSHEQRIEDGEREAMYISGGRGSPGKGSSKDQCPKTETCLTCWVNSKKDSVVGWNK